MKLIIGGAYQGKLEFAKTAFGIEDTEVFTCKDCEIDFTKPCIHHIEEFTLACIRAGVDTIAYFKDHKEAWEDSILICRDLFCGVVPLQAELRAWRQDTGRLCQYLSKEAESVSRIFCGLEQKLK